LEQEDGIEGGGGGGEEELVADGKGAMRLSTTLPAASGRIMPVLFAAVIGELT
jgi:hypothetical protein